jgi:hypothetical protein
VIGDLVIGGLVVLPLLISFTLNYYRAIMDRYLLLRNSSIFVLEGGTAVGPELALGIGHLMIFPSLVSFTLNNYSAISLLSVDSLALPLKGPHVLYTP